ncbi:MAG: phage tail tube protein [Lachnospiraceae bacterium]
MIHRHLVGSQTVVLYNVILKKIPIAILDDSAESLRIDIEFTFSDFEPY